MSDGTILIRKTSGYEVRFFSRPGKWGRPKLVVAIYEDPDDTRPQKLEVHPDDGRLPLAQWCPTYDEHATTDLFLRTYDPMFEYEMEKARRDPPRLVGT